MSDEVKIDIEVIEDTTPEVDVEIPDDEPAEINVFVKQVIDADHRNLSHRNDSDQHTIGSITGLQDALDGKQPSGSYATTEQLQAESTARQSADTNLQLQINQKMPLSTKYGKSVDLTMDSSTYVLTLKLKDQDGNELGTTQTVDLPLETVVVSGRYDATTKKVILTLKNGTEIAFSVADLVSGLQSEITTTNKLSSDLVDDTNKTHKFVSESEKTAWDNKMSGDTKYGKSLTFESGTLSLKDQDGTVLSTTTITIESIQRATLPTPSATESGKIYQYIGATDTNYTNAYFYKCNYVITTEGVSEHLNITQTDGPVEMGDFTYNVNTFKTAVGSSNANTYTFSCVGYPSKTRWVNLNTFSFIEVSRLETFDDNISHVYGWVDDANNFYYTNTKTPQTAAKLYSDSSLETESGYQYVSTVQRSTTGMGMWMLGSREAEIALADYGIYTPDSGFIGDVLSVEYVPAVAEVSSYLWQRVDVQPQGSTTGFANTDLNNLSATGEAHFVKPTDYATTSAYGVVKIGIDSRDSGVLIIENGALGINKATNSYSLTIGGNASTTIASTNIGYNSSAFGWGASAFGADAQVGTDASRVPGAIQIGRGQNTEAGSLYIGLSTNGSTWNNYKLLGSDGKIPTDRTTAVDDSSTTSTTLGWSASKLNTQFENKVTKNNAITAGTHSKITYDSKGLVTGGSDLALSDLGITATATELNYTDGVTSNIQTQLNSKQGVQHYIITEDMVTVERDDTYGVSPYNTSYKYTNITIDANAGVEWKVGALYYFVINSTMVVASAYRNVRIRIGTSGDWKPLYFSSSVAAGSSYFTKAYNSVCTYKTTYQSGGAVHLISDNNSTYSNMSASELTTGTATSARSISAKVLNDWMDDKIGDIETALEEIRGV